MASVKGSQRLRQAFCLLFVSMINRGRTPLCTPQVLSVSVCLCGRHVSRRLNKQNWYQLIGIGDQLGNSGGSHPCSRPPPPGDEAIHPHKCVAWTLAFCSTPQLSSVGKVAPFKAPTRRSVGFSKSHREKALNKGHL